MKVRRDWVLAVGVVVVLATASIGLVEATTWVGKPFPGFLVLQNRVVASAGLQRWPATEGGEIYQYEVVAVEGNPIRDVAAIHAHVQSIPLGTPIRYELRRGDRVVERVIETRLFDNVDLLLLFGAYLFCGLAFCCVAIGIRFLRGKDRVAVGTSLGLFVIGMYALTATDLYGPYRLFRVHGLFESMLFAGGLHLALVFPQPARILKRAPWIIAAIYSLAGLFAAFTQFGLMHPPAYVLNHRIAVNAFGVAAAVLLASQLWVYRRSTDFQARQRVKLLALGASAALLPPIAIMMGSATTGGGSPENLMGWTGAFLPLSIGYAVLRHDLLDVDSLLRRSLTYMILTAIVAFGYAAALGFSESLFRDQAVGIQGTVIVLGLISVAVLLPLRDRVQSTVDRVFFRQAYDFRRLVETVSARLARAADLNVISSEICGVVEEALHPASISLEIRTREARGLRLDSGGSLPIREAERQSVPFECGVGELAIPFRAEDRLVALLVLGRPLSGAYYSGEDRQLLQTLANQGAVAIENALRWEQLRELNRELESKVTERTSELARTLDELRDTQVQLVNREKMASLGQLVAGIAHEINNPINFVQGNIYFLRQYSSALTQSIERYEEAAQGDPAIEARFGQIRAELELDHVIGDLEQAILSCEEGVERTTTIVKDLRTFSRADDSAVHTANLNAIADSALNVLQSRLTNVEVRKEYGDLPPLEANPGQLSQVLLNLLTNAADAVGEQGEIVIRTEQSSADCLKVVIEDNGCGIDRQTLEHIFEPFFTTKEVGHGTGLGLAIAYGIVERHKGRIEATSEVGVGTRFEVELPVAPPDETISGDEG
jgi:signal transduction histidine kinase